MRETDTTLLCVRPMLKGRPWCSSPPQAAPASRDLPQGGQGGFHLESKANSRLFGPRLILRNRTDEAEASVELGTRTVPAQCHSLLNGATLGHLSSDVSCTPPHPKS